MEQEEVKVAVKPEVEKLQQTKRIYRGAQDIITKLDNILRLKQPHRSVFEWDAVELRMKLKDLCERLMFLQPVDYGRKAEELLWRKVYYDVISAVRKNKKHVRPGSPLECAYHTHLLAATGFYHHLLLRLQQQYKLNLCGIVDFVDAGDHWTSKGSLPPPGSKRAKARDWAEKACHRSLIYLGDLARYRQDFDGFRSRHQAQRFYHQALLLNPAMGMPHNQLGTLAGNKHQGLDCAYHYLRCWLSEIPFDGAIANLEKTLEQNVKRYQELPRQANRDLPPDLQRPRDLKHFLIKFLYLQELLRPSSWPPQDQLAPLCQSVVHDFSLCMYHTLTRQHASQPRHKPAANSLPARGTDGAARESTMSDDLVFKLFVMMMMTIHQLQKKDRKWVSAAIAFMLAMFTHLLTHVNERLQSALYEAQHPKRVGEDEEDSSDESSSQTDESGNEQRSIAGTITPTHSQEVESSGTCSDGTVKHLPQKEKRRKAFNKLRRRRRPLVDGRTESDDSDLSEGAQSPSGGSDFSSSEGDQGSSEGGLLLSDSDYLMDSQDQEDHTPERNKEKREETDKNKDEALVDGKKELTQAEKAKEWSATSPVSLAQNLRDMSSRLLAPSPTGFLKRSIRLAPSFDAYVKDKVETCKEGAGLEAKTDDASTTQDKTGDKLASQPTTPAEEAEDKPYPLDLLIKVLIGERLLGTVKLVTDWLRGNSDVITTTAENIQMLWSKLALLLNHLPQVEDICSEEWCKSTECLEAISDSLHKPPSTWQQIIPLTEDVAVMKLPSLGDTQKVMAFDQHLAHNLTEQDETLLRVVCLRQFGHFLTSVKDLCFVYNSEGKAFLAQPREGAVDAASAESMGEDAKPAEKEERRSQMMKDLAVRWLEHEIQQLECRVEDGAANTQFSPYLVPDANALMNHLGLIQLLADSQRFIVIVPYAVVGHLDHFKKKQFEAREASRFLEQILKKGNRHIRVQRQQEVLLLDKEKKPKDKDKSIKTLYQIIECSLYFNQRATSPDSASSGQGMVTILTDYRPGQLATCPQALTAVEMAQERGLRVENAAEFYQSWKNSEKS